MPRKPAAGAVYRPFRITLSKAPDVQRMSVMIRRGSPIALITFLALAAALFCAGGCATDNGFEVTKAAVNQAIANEPPGNYFIGRRMYRRAYFFWGYVRRPRQPWSTAQLVMLNEQKLHAPDRVAGLIGYDNSAEYRLEGYFSGEQVYEPASNQFYPEFVLTNYRLLSSTPAQIFRDPRATDPNRLAIDKPE
ncbi:MAG: hypothetical protein JO069_10430 [Verrucomicrobia bacterium]|nr:hypothetical protein [Verrucomicrobiota bacterium]